MRVADNILAVMLIHSDCAGEAALGREHSRRYAIFALSLLIFLSGCDNNPLITLLFPDNRIECDIVEHRAAILSAVERTGDLYDLEPAADFSPDEDKLVDISFVDGTIQIRILSEGRDRIGVDWHVFFPRDQDVELAETIADAMLVALEEVCAQ